MDIFSDDNRFATYFFSYIVVEKGLSSNTVEAYKRDLRLFSSYLDSVGVGVLKVDVSVVNGFVSSVSASHSVSSVSRILATLRAFYKFLVMEGYLGVSPMVDVKNPKLGVRLPKALSVFEVEQLLNAPDLESVVGVRDKALLEILYGCGLRISEAVNLTVDDFRLDEDGVSVLQVLGKGGKERIVPVGSYAMEAVRVYLTRSRPVLASKGRGCSFLFLNKRGGRLSRQSAWEVLQFNADRCGLGTQVSPHTLRHCFATHLLEGGADVRVVQELLGHSNVTTTQIYTKVTVNTLREVYSLSHPRAL